MRINKCKNRVLFLSPTVQAGWEPESFRTDFQSLKTLGQGSYGTVWKAKHKKTSRIYAIKEIKKKSLTSQQLIQHVKTEVRVMYRLNHPNIVKLYNHFEDEVSIYFILQFVEQGQLYKLLMKQPQQRFNEPVCAKLMFEIIQALQFIHQQGIIHRDIKPENILVTESGSAKMADFGWSNFVNSPNSKRETYCGTLDYLAPEMVSEGHKHDYRVDIWSIGVLIFETCTGRSPFSYELMKSNTLTEQKVKLNIKNVLYSYPQSISLECYDLIKKLLTKQPQDRLSLEQVLKHPWMLNNLSNEIKTSKEYLKSSKQQWISSLKNTYTKISPYDNTDKFTNDEIYSFSRMDSIINQKPEDKSLSNSEATSPNSGSPFKKQDTLIKTMELRIKELELFDKMKEEEIKVLKQEREGDHGECQKTINGLMEKLKSQNKQIEEMHRKILDNERKLREQAMTNN